MIDFAAAAGLAGSIVLIIVAYGVRVLLRGHVRSKRVEQIDGSAVLGKALVQIGYWPIEVAAGVLARLGLTANALTWAALVTGAAAGVALAAGHIGLGAVFAWLSAAFDGLDGPVARAHGTASDAGEVLDATVDRYTEFFFLGGLAIHYRQNVWLLALALLALLGSIMISYSSAKAEAVGVEVPRGTMRRHERSVYLCLGAMFAALSAPWLAGVDPHGYGWPLVAAVGVVALLANVSAVRRASAMMRSVRARDAKLARERSASAELPAVVSAITPETSSSEAITPSELPVHRATP